MFEAPAKDACPPLFTANKQFVRRISFTAVETSLTLTGLNRHAGRVDDCC